MRPENRVGGGAWDETRIRTYRFKGLTRRLGSVLIAGDRLTRLGTSRTIVGTRWLLVSLPWP